MEVRAEEHCAESETDGDLDVGGGEILSEHDYEARHFDGAGSAYAGGGGRDLPHGAQVRGELATGPEMRSAEEVEVKPEAVGVSGAGQRVSRGDRGRERWKGTDDPEPALLGGGTVGSERGGCVGIAASRRAAWRGNCVGIDAEWIGRMLLSRVAEGGRDGICATLLSVVDRSGIQDGLRGGGGTDAEPAAGRRSAADEGVRGGSGADCFSASGEEQLRHAGGGGVRGRSSDVLFGERLGGV